MANLVPNNPRSAGLMSGGVVALSLSLVFAVGGIALFAMQQVVAIGLIGVGVVFAILGARKLTH